MIIPKYWAEAKTKTKFEGKQYTIKRFGWSDKSFEATQIHTEQRVTAAIEQIKVDQNIRRIDHKVAYNGAEGLPIREEIVAQHDDVIITRNTYGALCLNTPDVLFEGVWPVKDERLAQRESWVRHYEQHARHYASCRFIQQFGSQTIHEKAKRVQSLHDEYCKSSTQLDIA